MYDSFTAVKNNSSKGYLQCILNGMLYVNVLDKCTEFVGLRWGLWRCNLEIVEYCLCINLGIFIVICTGVP